MTTPDETLHFSDDEREVFRLRAKVLELEKERDAILAALPATTNGDCDLPGDVRSLTQHVRALEECNRLSNESALLSAGRIRELEAALRAVVEAPHEPEGRFDRAYLDAVWQRARAVLEAK